jgi:hypothetical protein
MTEANPVDEFNYDSIPLEFLSTQQFAEYRYWQLFKQLQKQKLNNHVFRARMINNTRKLRKEWQPKTKHPPPQTQQRPHLKPPTHQPKPQQ